MINKIKFNKKFFLNNFTYLKSSTIRRDSFKEMK